MPQGFLQKVWKAKCRCWLQNLNLSYTYIFLIYFPLRIYSRMFKNHIYYETLVYLNKDYEIIITIIFVNSWSTVSPIIFTKNLTHTFLFGLKLLVLPNKQFYPSMDSDINLHGRTMVLIRLVTISISMLSLSRTKLKATETLSSFKLRLKTYLFRAAFD